MYRPTRQRGAIRLCLFAVFVITAITWLYPSWLSSTSIDVDDPCYDSGACYDLLLETYQEQEREKLGLDKDSAVEADEVKSQIESQQPEEFERVKGAFVVLVRNNELYAMRSSMQYLEDRFNHKYHYPWIFLNEEPFTEEFKTLTTAMTQSEVHYGLVPKEHWGYPDWINQTYAAECRQDMHVRGIVYGGSESYRHMCRFQSGFFYLHPLLDGLEYYWRVEPGVKFSCEIEYDPFRVMKERDLKYGFTMALVELADTVPSLWKATVEFAKSHPQYIYPRSRPDSLFEMVTDDRGVTYNLCHFWSNFEIASLDFMRSPGYRAYFDFLDRKGGFFYERWGDAPVHSLAASLMLRKQDVHWFYDIGYMHDYFEHCPTEPHWLTYGKCYCDPGASFDQSSGSCTNRFLEVMGKTVDDYIVTKNPEPEDIRL
ncbi:glycosyl transferase [Hesseltinella vesiculosa]|uniref:Glycosyl transferase n=1 Tax=Hesseltinella vesiculosa TaxID=101127 RepID=A0A1X2GSC1_9FUNG|nr:glycosyl transferase [Hesseltinella vesiculosa]